MSRATLGIRHGANAGTVQQAAGSVWSGRGASPAWLGYPDWRVQGRETESAVFYR